MAPLSSILFICALEKNLSKFKLEGERYQNKWKVLNNLRFVNHIVLIAKSLEELNEILQELSNII